MDAKRDKLKKKICMVQSNPFTYYLTSIVLFMAFIWVAIQIAILRLIYFILQLWPNIGSVKPECGFT